MIAPIRRDDGGNAKSSSSGLTHDRGINTEEDRTLASFATPTDSHLVITQSMPGFNEPLPTATIPPVPVVSIAVPVCLSPFVPPNFA
jgi:hypothetical protein